MRFPSKHAVIVVLLWAFAPLAWFLMWRDKKYHSWFPKLLWINGIIFGVIFITQSFVAIPRLNAIYDALRIHVPSYVHPTAILLVLLFLAGQIVAGHILQRMLNRKNGESQKHFADKLVFPIIVIFALDGILGIITGILTTLTPAALLEPSFKRFFPLPTRPAVISALTHYPITTAATTATTWEIITIEPEYREHTLLKPRVLTYSYKHHQLRRSIV